MGMGLALALTTGCHAKFKKHVGQIDHVKPDMIVLGGPQVNLGMTGDDSLLGAVVDTVQGVRSIDLSRRISGAVDPDAVGAAFLESLDEGMKKRPFDIRDKSRYTLEVQLVRYGIDVAHLGAPGALTYSFHTRVYMPDGKRVYNAGHNCALSFSDPQAASVVLGTVNNAKAIKEMSDEEIATMFDNGARYCADIVVSRIRKHGG
jgi:hypothetical protein